MDVFWESATDKFLCAKAIRNPSTLKKAIKVYSKLKQFSLSYGEE